MQRKWFRCICVASLNFALHFSLQRNTKNLFEFCSPLAVLHELLFAYTTNWSITSTLHVKCSQSEFKDYSPWSDPQNNDFIRALEVLNLYFYESKWVFWLRRCWFPRLYCLPQALSSWRLPASPVEILLSLVYRCGSPLVNVQAIKSVYEIRHKLAVCRDSGFAGLLWGANVAPTPKMCCFMLESI